MEVKPLTQETNGVIVANGKQKDGDDIKKGKGKISSMLSPKKTESVSAQKVSACVLKTFNRMKKRIGFLIYQFILPALQVIEPY